MGTKNYQIQVQDDLEYTIPISTDTSDSIDFIGTSFTGILVPSAFTGTSITFEGSTDNVNFFPIFNTEGAQLSATVGVNRIVNFIISDFAGIRYVKIVSSATETAERIIKVLNRPVT